MNLELWKWLAHAPFGEDMYLMISLKTLQEYEQLGFTVASSVVNRSSQPEPLAPTQHLATMGGKRLEVSTTMRDNEVRLFNSWGLQAVFLLKPLSRDLKTPEPNHITWPSPQMNT